MIKKILAGILAAACVLLATEKVWADTISTDGGTSSVPVRFTVDNTAFEITIPAVIMPKGNETDTFSIGASRINLRPDEEIDVTIIGGCSQDGEVRLVRQNVPDGKEAAYLTTTLSTSGQNISGTGFLVGKFRDGADSTVNLIGDVTMSALEIDESTQAGDYLAVIEFRVDLKRDGN